MLPPDPGEIVHLQRLEIENVRCFERFELDFKPPEDDERGQWTILLGDNGVGKSTILRSIALASADQQVAWNLLSKLGGNWVRRGSESGSRVHLVSSLGDWEQSYQQPEGKGDTGVKGERGATPMVLAYGTDRGSALGGPDRAVRLEAQLEGRQTLFYQGSLVHAETWLKNLAFAATESDLNQEFFDSVRETLAGLLPGVEELDVRSDGVWASGPNVGRVPLDALSDGFLTTLGWSLDLVARWAHLAKSTDVELGGDFREAMTGLVLIDELDLHLHPRWQIEIVTRLRETFPRMSFVATTHNPLTLRGARPGEIQVLERKEDQIEVQQIDIRPGLRADELLTGSWFGLKHTLDNDTIELLERYQKMVVASPEDSEVREVEDELRSRLGSFADTEEERVALKLVAEETKSGPLDKGSKTRLKQKMSELLKKES